MPSRLWRRAALLLALGWAGVLWYLSDQPGLDVPPLFPMQDKFMHLGAYAVLGALTMASRPLDRPATHRNEYIGVSLVAGAYGILDEFHQSFVPGRDADVFDVLADFSGVLIGAAAVLWLWRRIDRTRIAGGT